VKAVTPIFAAFLLILSGCGLDRPKPSAAAYEEVRHPSNEMVPLKREPEPKKPVKATVAKRPPAKPANSPAFEDPRQIPAGINYSEMVRRFGPPSMKVVDSPARTTYSYSKVKTQVQVEVQNGKVVSVAAINTGL
jgi:hypothetical protein